MSTCLFPLGDCCYACYIYNISVSIHLFEVWVCSLSVYLLNCCQICESLTSGPSHAIDITREVIIKAIQNLRGIY